MFDLVVYGSNKILENINFSVFIFFCPPILSLLVLFYFHIFQSFLIKVLLHIEGFYTSHSFKDSVFQLYMGSSVISPRFSFVSYELIGKIGINLQITFEIEKS